MAILTPDFVDKMSWAMAEVYGAVTDQILINLAHYFPYFDESKLPASSFAYQADMLAQMGQVNRETTAIIRRALGDADDTLKKVLNQAIMHSVNAVNPALWSATVQGIFSAPKAPVLAPNQMHAFKLYYQQAAQKLNLVNTVMLESTKQAYQATVADIANRVQVAQSALNIAAGEAVTGVSTWNTAAKHAMDRLKDGGIVGFIDHGGHRWSAEAYTAMDIRTTVANTARAAVWETNESFGNDLYVVSYHNGARPLCYPWQNKVISSTDNARTVTDLDGNEIQVIAQSDTSYGQAAGLFGVNCKHYPSPFIPGVSLIRGEPQDEKANAKAYAESQEQRRLERRVREEKRDLLMEKARGAPQSVIDAQRERVRAAQADVQDFCDSTGRERRKDREGVYTKREFPDKNTYDVTTFTREQKKLYDDYWQNKGVQQAYTPGTMIPKAQPQAVHVPQVVRQPVPQVKTASPTPTVPTMTAEQYDNEIAALRAKRQALFDAGTYNKAETDRMLADILRLEDEKAMLRPANEPDFLKQFKRYNPDSKTAAEKLAQVNPNFKKGTFEWTNNCQRTVAAQEMVYRGYNVTAKPVKRNDAIGYSGTAVWKVRSEFWKDPDCIILQKSGFQKTIEAAFDKWGDGSRAIVRIKWGRNYGGSGHFIFARRVGGKVIFEDPQSNKVLDFANDTLQYITTGKNQMWALRVDNRAVNEKIVLAIKNAGE